ncbi:MAG: hypothetical protein ABIQ72_16575 [Usitatibacter sp.]
MYYQYPLEVLARKRGTLSQIEFAREAKRVLLDTDELLAQPGDRGLAILAANEEALFQPARVLRDVYGDVVELRRPRIRYMRGEPMLEPVMHVRITARREYAGRVLAELRVRDVRVIEECHRSRIYIVRAESPLVAVLGLPARLDTITGGSADCAIRLIRYAPVPSYPDGDGPGGFAA